MSEIDWSKAPEGATHWELESEDAIAGWMKIDREEWFVLSSEGLWLKNVLSDVSAERLRHMIARPSPAWSGEGICPVGVSIEWFSPVYGWLGGKVVGHDGTVTVVAHNDGYAGCHPHEVRPIRTPEQIAAERIEREQALSKACEIAGCAPGSLIGDAVKKLIDAYYRKP